MAPVFLTLGEVLAIHESVIHRYGGSLGVRELTLLQSALGMPEATFGGGSRADKQTALAFFKQHSRRKPS